MMNSEKIIKKVRSEKITIPQLLYKDNVGNTLWIKYIKTRGRTQFFAKNADNKLVNEEGLAILVKESGISFGKPISPKGRRIEKYMQQHTFL